MGLFVFLQNLGVRVTYRINFWQPKEFKTIRLVVILSEIFNCLSENFDLKLFF